MIIKTTALALISTILAAPIYAQGFPADAVKARCASDFPGDFFMQKGCLELNKDSWTTLPNTIDGIPADVGPPILAKCKSDFPGDFFMQRGCADLQVDAWKSLNQ